MAKILVTPDYADDYINPPGKIPNIGIPESMKYFLEIDPTPYLKENNLFPDDLTLAGDGTAEDFMNGDMIQIDDNNNPVYYNPDQTESPDDDRPIDFTFNDDGSLANNENILSTDELSPETQYDIDSDSDNLPADEKLKDWLKKGEKDLESMITNSNAYKSAYELFSSDSRYGKIFLIRLQNIPTSAITAKQTIWDKLYLSNHYEDVLRSTYQYCMEQISNLIVEYQGYINSLPTTQVQQLSDAGINASVTGQGVESSVLNPSDTSTDPSSIPSTNSADYLSNLLNLFTTGLPNLVTNVVNSWRTIKDYNLADEQLNFSKDSALSGLWTQLNDMGYDMGGAVFNDYVDVRNWLESTRFSTKSENLRLSNFIDSYWLSLKSRSIQSKIDDSTHILGKTYEEFYNDLGNHMISQFFNEYAYSAELAKFNYEYTKNKDASDAADMFNYSNQFGRENHKYHMKLIQERLDFINKWKTKIINSNDQIAKSAFSEFLMGVNDTFLGRNSKILGGAVNKIL